jgi:hypothetical protein
LLRRRGLHHRAAADCRAAAASCRAAGSAFVNALPLPSSSRRRSLRRRATVSAFVVTPLLPSSSRRRCLHCRAAVPAFVVGLPVRSVLQEQRWNKQGQAVQVWKVQESE